VIDPPPPDQNDQEHVDEPPPITKPIDPVIEPSVEPPTPAEPAIDPATPADDAPPPPVVEPPAVGDPAPVAEPIPDPANDPLPPVDQPSDETVAPVTDPSLPTEGVPDEGSNLPGEPAENLESPTPEPDTELATRPIESAAHPAVQGDANTTTGEVRTEAGIPEAPTPEEFVALLDDDEAIELIRAGVAPEAVLGVLTIPTAPVLKTSAPGKPAATHAAVGSTLASGDSGQSPHGGGGAASAALFGDRPNTPPAFQALQLSTANLYRFSIAYPPLIPPA
jgi:fused signal recognition particle receptor